MKDANEVLRQKELEVANIRSQIRALHRTIPLLADEKDFEEFGLVRPSMFCADDRL